MPIIIKQTDFEKKGSNSFDIGFKRVISGDIIRNNKVVII